MKIGILGPMRGTSADEPLAPTMTARSIGTNAKPVFNGL